MVLLMRQPTMRRANTSITNATYYQPCHVETYVKSDTHNWLWTIRCELPMDTVQRALHRFVSDGGRTTLPRRTPHAAQASVAHEAFNRATCHDNALPFQLMPNLVGTVDLHVGLPDLVNPCQQDFILFGTGTTQLWAASPSGMAAVTQRGDLQYCADRLDPVGGAMLVDESDQDLSLRSSSACAKKRWPV